MQESKEIKSQFIAARDKLFSDEKTIKDAFKFCVRFSLLVEEYIHLALKGKRKNFVLVSSGSFSRRELSPYSDIDVMFIFSEVAGNEKSIQDVVTRLWDCGLEVSHTIRDFSDIEKFAKDDLHSFTQFFETRFLLGDEKVYKEWNEKLFASLTNELKEKLIYEYFEDINQRHKRHGESPKVLEPNVKFSAGGLRDLHSVEWMYSLKNDIILSEQSEITQTENFLKRLRKEEFLIPVATNRLLQSYKTVLHVRNFLHLLHKRKIDRFEFADQEKMAEKYYSGNNAWLEFMKEYFNAANVIHRFSKTMVKQFDEIISNPISEYMQIKLDDDFIMKGNVISLTNQKKLMLGEILRVFYYRALHDARFSKSLRSQIIEDVYEMEEAEDFATESSVFFREILKLPANVGKALNVMNEMGALGVYLHEFREMVGFFQPGVYHCYTADEHTLVALRNVEELQNSDSELSKIFASSKKKDLLYLAILFHDIAKPISVSGHEIIGAQIATSIMERLGYEESEIDLVQFLVRHHLTMEQTAFRRNINDGATLNNFSSLFKSVEQLDLLYLVTYGDLSAVSPVVWTNWKAELLNQLYRKTRAILMEKISGEELIYSDAMEALKDGDFADEELVKSHVESINDLGYIHHFTQQEINDHVEEIESGVHVSVFFKQEKDFTNVTVITKDTPSLLSRLCGALSINDLNIHDAKIFTRKDNIVIDSFNVTDFRTSEVVDESRYDKIKNDIEAAVEKRLQISKEFTRVKSKWWRIESKLFKRKGKVKIEFEDHDKYTIIDVFSPDRLGLLYQITQKMYMLGLQIYFAKISTKSDDIVDSFYVLDNKKRKISANDYELISHELSEVIEEML